MACCLPVAAKGEGEHDARNSRRCEYPSPAGEIPIPSKRKKTAALASRTASAVLDSTNLAILRHLTAQPGLAIRELARRVDMSAPAVNERVLRLKEAGVIKREWLEVDPQALGLAVTAYVRVRPMPGGLAKIIKLAQSTPEVVECHRVTGEDCLMMKVLAPDVQQLEGLLDRFLMHGNTTSSLIVSSPVPPRNPPLPESQ
jgi:Lrp/AsnC family transcriptional regulator, leucine-responsive regulatory protein